MSEAGCTMSSSQEGYKQAPEPVCICERAHTVVICRLCGWTTKNKLARVKRTCQVHPKTIYLMDLEKCPAPICGANAFMLVEFPPESLALQH